jgi:histone acetyltransferase SAS3
VIVAYFASKLAAAVSFAMAEPGRLMGHTASNAEPEDIDADGDYEMDDEYEQDQAAEHQTPQAEGHSTDAEGSDVDAEGEEVDDEEDEAEPVGAVKIALRRPIASDEEDDYDNDEEAAAHTSDAKTSDSEDDSSAESEEEVPWQAESEDGEEADAVKSNPNVCM